MKATIYKLSILAILICFSMPVTAQCPSEVDGTVSVASAARTMAGQTFRNSCGFSLTSVRIDLFATTDATLTMNIRSSACSGSILSNGTATIPAGSAGFRTFSFPSAVSLASNTDYFIEITGSQRNLQRIVINNTNPYSNGVFHFGTSTNSCQTNAAHDLAFSLLGSVLPVELVQFDVQNTKGGKNHLTWRTENEHNNSHFDIERSTDGTTFHSIGQIKGNNKPSRYQYVDASPFALSYYRLKQIDFDGTETFSKTITIQRTDKRPFVAVYPNPVSNLLTIETGASNFDYHIINLLGQVILRGTAQTQIDVSALPQGSYVLKMGSEQVKFMKQ
jgi:hypothetical protein